MIVKKRHPSTQEKPQQQPRPLHQFTLIRWCRYGRWSNDGQHVMNAAGDIIYPFLQRRKR